MALLRLLVLLAVTSTLFASLANAQTRYITVNDAVNITLEQDIGTVFISAPTIADYKVVNNNNLVLFANEVGNARVIVYGREGQVLLSQAIFVDIDLSQVRRQLKLSFPELDIKIESVGEQVAVRGTVYSSEQRENVYRLVARLLNREREERYDNEANNKEDITDTPPWVDVEQDTTYIGIIEGLELATTQQVNVKVSIAQVSQEFNQTIGTDWSSIGNASGMFSFQQFDASDLSTLVTAIGQDSIAEVLAEPNLTVMSSESANFLVGGEVPVIVTSSSATNITYKEFGIKLGVAARVLHNDKIRLQLSPEVSSVTGTAESAGIQVPLLTTRKAMTTLELADGESFMLGGLMSSDDLEKASRIPLLGDLPILGAAFSKASTQRTKSELVIIATVNLVQPVASETIRLPHINKTSTLERLLNLTPSSHQQSDPDAEAMTLDILSQGGFIQ
ncbi:pilus assembly protein CpaC [Photobacterium sanctipauli]|uniref:Pilus assembly protein CpaC n=1 Tax=Photobacterium sanctipauli TaxID=1342794 RepID=A0A2T3NPY9_9GAMM|nr:pilus assembly protein N-terminal domain-containing protein [Photobacterium sanctipauli]PSW18344.1 pilus assembly protein CpaC [Photobacterium sanctipauli]